MEEKVELPITENPTDASGAVETTETQVEEIPSAGPAVSTIGSIEDYQSKDWNDNNYSGGPKDRSIGAEQHAADTAAFADFKDLTTGIDPRGIQRVLENEIKVGIIDEAIKVIKESSNFEEFKKACEKGWKGQARLKFFEKVDEDRTLVCDDMEAEYWSIYNRFNEMADSYRSQDLKLGEDI